MGTNTRLSGIDRTAGDVVTYPDDDVQIVQVQDGRLQVVRKDGSPF